MILMRATLVALAALTAASDIDFISTWRAPGTEPLNFGGRKVAAVFMIDDNNLRVSTEEALAREISARGPIGVAAYRIIPKELLKDKDQAKTWFERQGIQGLVALRLVKTETDKVYSSAVWASGYYNYAWDYWGYGWASVYPLGQAREEKTFTVETLLFDLSKGAPIWAGVSRTTDPKDVQSYVKDLSKEVVKKLQGEGLIRKSGR
jgi:hypothetical protein